MNIDQKCVGTCVVVTVSGRLDASTAPEAEKVLTESMAAAEPRLVLDLAGVDYVSSAGLRVLLATAKRVKRERGRLVLCGLQEQVREVLEMSGMLPLFTVAADEAAAVEQAG